MDSINDESILDVKKPYIFSYYWVRGRSTIMNKILTFFSSTGDEQNFQKLFDIMMIEYI